MLAAPDRPLQGRPAPHRPFHPELYASEMVGTALLVFAGLSVVILVNAPEGPVAPLIPSAGARRAIAGFLFGSVGAVVAYSPVGRISGAHINPAMTFAFWLEGKIHRRDALCFVLAQCAGAVAGASALAVWGGWGRSLSGGATVPGVWGAAWATAGEMLCGFLLVVLLFGFAARRRTRPYTPLVNAPLFCLLVWLEGPLSGASANPARSFGPALISGVWQDHWVYWLGPLAGAALGVAAARLELFGPHRPKEARCAHFRHHVWLEPHAPAATAGEPR